MTCPNCDNPTSARYVHLQYYRCLNCGVYFLSGYTEQQISDYYANGDYRTKNQQPNELEHQGRRAENITKYIDAPQVFIDVGASAGILTDAVHAKSGAVCYGVDLDPLLTHNVYADIKDVPEPADCITLIHSLEHMARPLDMLKDVYAKMNTGGRLIIEVPNGNITATPCYYVGSFAFPHIVMFDAGSLAWTMQAAGFEVVETLLHGDGGLVGAPAYFYLLAIGKKV